MTIALHEVKRSGRVAGRTNFVFRISIFVFRRVAGPPRGDWVPRGGAPPFAVRRVGSFPFPHAAVSPVPRSLSVSVFRISSPSLATRHWPSEPRSGAEIPTRSGTGVFADPDSIGTSHCIHHHFARNFGSGILHMCDALIRGIEPNPVRHSLRSAVGQGKKTCLSLMDIGKLTLLRYDR